MFSFQPEQRSNQQYFLPPAIRGLNVRDPLAGMKEGFAVALENWIPYPDRLEMRAGAVNHVTGFAETVKGLWAWEGPSSRKLFATTDDGIYDVTSAGSVGAAASAITSGRTVGTTIATGAGTYLMLVNGTDDLRHYNGTTWTTVATFGSLNSNTVNSIETYKQRIFMGQENTLTLWYLGANSISGSATSYPLGAIFRRGGSIQALGTWTLDGGNGPDDNLVVVTTAGEVAVFSGTDPASSTAWSLRGVYYIGRPLGPLCLYKFGGDLLFLTELGIFPLTKALQLNYLDRSLSITDTVQSYFSTAVQTYFSTEGWQAILDPETPLLIINLPGYSEGRQLVMNTQSKAWAVFTGWTAECWARLGGDLYFGTGIKVAKALTGFDDFGTNITASVLHSFSRFGYPKQKRVAAIRPYLTATGDFDYTLGMANDFALATYETVVAGGVAGSSLWGTGLWGSAIWTGGSNKKDWRVVPDVAGVHKAPYLQVRSSAARVSMQGWDVLYHPGGTF